MLNRLIEYQRMSSVEHKLWWYRVLQKMVLNALESYISKNNRTIDILDAGCGTGGLIRFLYNQGYTKVEGFDASDQAVDYCKSFGLIVWKELAGFKSDNRIERRISKYSAIICLDVLYFLDEIAQHKFLDDCYRWLKKDGILILNVPALNCFKGIHDQAVGIDRRFTKKILQKLSNSNKFEIISMTFWPFLLSPIIYLTRLFQRIRLAWGFYTNVEIDIRSDIEMPNKYVNKFLFNLTSWEVEKISKLSFLGSSIFIVLKK